MKRKLVVLLTLVAAALAVPSLAKVSAAETITIRMATLAPPGSSWDKVFRAWNNSLKEKTGGALQIQLFAGGVAGDERDVIRKMKLGQMDAAGLTSIGLGQIARPVLVLQMPGIFDSYEQLNKVRDALSPEMEQLFAQENYKLLGWGDAGMARIFSKKPLIKPSDYKSVRPWVPKEDPVMPELMKLIGANGVALGIPEVFPALQTGMVDTVLSSAIAAVALQWFRYVTHVSKNSQVAVVGATVIRDELFKSIPPEHQKVLVETSDKAHKTLITQVQKEDASAYKTLIGRGLTEFDPDADPAAKAEWKKINDELLSRLTGKIFSKELLEKVKEKKK